MSRIRILLSPFHGVVTGQLAPSFDGVLALALYSLLDVDIQLAHAVALLGQAPSSLIYSLETLLGDDRILSASHERSR